MSDELSHSSIERRRGTSLSAPRADAYVLAFLLTRSFEPNGDVMDFDPIEGE